MSRLAASSKTDFIRGDIIIDDFMHDVAVSIGCCIFAGFKVVKKPTIHYRCTTQLVPGYQYADIGSYEAVSVNIEASSFWDSTTTPGTIIYEHFGLDNLHDNGSYGMPSITLERLVGENGASYGELDAAEFELTGFYDSGGRDVSELCSVQDSENYEEYSGASEPYSFCASGGSFDEYSNISAGLSRGRTHDGYSGTLGPSNIQDNDSGDDVLVSHGHPPLILFCDKAGKLSISGTRCDLKVVVGQVPTDGATDSLTYLSGGTDDFPEAFKPDDDSLHSDASPQNGAFLQGGISTNHSHYIQLQSNQWRKPITIEKEVVLERKQARQALVACNICFLKQILQDINDY